MFKVAKQCCNECLISANKIVSDKRRDEILASIKKEQSHFVCHKATIAGEDICCRGWFEKHGDEVNKIRIFKRLGMIEFVDLPVVEE